VNIFSVTLHFATEADADWFRRCAHASVQTHSRLDACRAGIMQDSLAKAFAVEPSTRVVGEPQPETPIEYAAWETDGGTTERQNEERFSR